MLEIDTCVAEARTLHPSEEGWFAIFRKNAGAARTSDRSYPMGSLDAVVRALDKVPDAYLSQASFMRPSRKVVNFKSINCAFVDIDCYSGAHNSPVVVPDDAFIERLHEHARAAGIPTPSYTTLSGRGVYCKWIFDRPLCAHQLIRWKALQAVLVPLYTAFGVDSKVKDAARVLRIMGSTHAGTGAIVRVGSNSHQVHNFDALCAAAASVDISRLVMPTRAGAGAARAAKSNVGRIKLSSENLGELNQNTDGDLQVLRDYEARREPAMLKVKVAGRGCDLLSLNWSRFIDMRTLAELRGGIHPGSRDIMMFWMATSLAHAGVVTSGNLESEIGEMLGAFSGPDFDPLGDRSLMSLVERLKEKEAGRVVHFKGGSYDPVYTPTNDYLIDVLDITAEEQEKLTTIISGKEKLRRADAKVEGRAERREHRIEWRGLARQMEAQALAAGETRYITRIARELKVERAEVSRLLAGKMDKLEGDQKKVETRGRKKQKRLGRMVKIVVARRGSLSRSIWVSSEQAAKAALDRAMGLVPTPSQPPAPGPSVPRPTLLLQRDLGSRSETSSSSAFSQERLKSLANIFPNRVNRVIFSLSRKKGGEEGAFARKRESEVFQEGGPLAKKNVAVRTTHTQAAAQKWSGWEALTKVGAARKGIVGSRQGNQKAIPSEGRVTIKRADGTLRSIPILPISVIMNPPQKKARPSRASCTSKKARPHWINEDGTMDFVKLRAEAARLQEEESQSREAARVRNVALEQAERARGALELTNRVRAFCERAKAKAAAAKSAADEGEEGNES